MQKIGNAMNYAYIEMMQDIGKWLKIDANGYPVWANLPVYQGGVS